MNDLSVRKGATLPLRIELSDVDAVSADFIVKKLIGDEVPVISLTKSFVSGVADLTLTSEQTKIEPGEYIYQITVNYEDDVVEKYPELSCNDDGDDIMEFPKLIIGESLDD